MSPLFREILTDLGKYRDIFGGVRNFAGGRPEIEKKVKARDFKSSYTDYEYIYLTVLGFAQLHLHAHEIAEKNNGQKFNLNPGVQLLEQTTGMTMHADRDGANNMLRTVPACLVEAFELSKKARGGTKTFFIKAFDRTADPCLEGRAGRILDYLSQLKATSGGGPLKIPPWEDVSLEPRAPDATAKDIVGEHLRVFVNECTWRWSQDRGIDYYDAKTSRQSEPEATDFAKLYNATTFKATLLSRGVVEDVDAKCWEVQLDNGLWSPFTEEQNLTLERGRVKNLKGCQVRVNQFLYEIDFTKMVQRNTKTGKTRQIRCLDQPAGAAHGSVKTRLPVANVEEAINFFVEMQTLPPATKTESETELNEETYEELPNTRGSKADGEPAPRLPPTSAATVGRPAPTGAATVSMLTAAAAS